MLSVVANAATALKIFWLWRHLFASQAEQMKQEHYLVSLVCRFDYILNELIHETPIPNEYQVLSSFQVQQLASQVQHGIIPSLQELTDAFPDGTESPEAKHLLIRYIYFLNRAGEMGKLRSEQLNLTLQLQSRESLLSHLKGVYAKYQPESHEAKEFRNCALYLQNAIYEMEQALIPLLEQDPSQGEIIYLKSNRYQLWGYKAWQWLNRFLGITPVLN
jgi:hypothetical protein